LGWLRRAGSTVLFRQLAFAVCAVEY